LIDKKGLVDASQHQMGNLPEDLGELLGNLT